MHSYCELLDPPRVYHHYAFDSKALSFNDFYESCLVLPYSLRSVENSSISVKLVDEMLRFDLGYYDLSFIQYSNWTFHHFY